MNAGQPASAGLSAAFPVVIPVALSFKVFGIGAWQARLPGVLLLFASLPLLSRLGLLLYNQRVALAVLAILLLMSSSGQLRPLQVGRAVLGEMPMLFFLLAGWTCLLGALAGRTWLLVPGVFFWGLGLDAKSRAFPFWLAPLFLPLIVALWKSWWREALILVCGAGGGWVMGRFLLGFSASWLLWYALFSIGWDRYLFPAMFIGSIFIAALLDTLTAGFDFKGVIRRANAVILQRQVSRDWMRA